MVRGHAAGDKLSNIENIIGTFHADTLIGNDGDNIFEGMGERGYHRWGAGIDTATLSRSRKRCADRCLVTDDDGVSVGQGGVAEGDKLSNIENLIGSNHVIR